LASLCYPHLLGRFFFPTHTCMAPGFGDSISTLLILHPRGVYSTSHKWGFQALPSPQVCLLYVVSSQFNFSPLIVLRVLPPSPQPFPPNHGHTLFHRCNAKIVVSDCALWKLFNPSRPLQLSAVFWSSVTLPYKVPQEFFKSFPVNRKHGRYFSQVGLRIRERP